MIPILILAAGQSRRMHGRDKLLESVGGAPLLRHHVVEALATGHPVFVTLPDHDHPRVACLDGLDVTIIPVPDATEGMAISLRTGVAALPEAEAILVSLADMVNIRSTDLKQVLQARDDTPDALIWRGTAEDGTPGHPVLFDASLRPAFADLTGDQGAAPILKANADRVHGVPLPGDHATCDLDTPEDWADWRLLHS